jgi:AbrB family looped-hinge helix DNA binding protein
MKVGERGQVTIPKQIRDQFGIRPSSEVEFEVVNGSIVLKKKPKKPGIEKWIGYCRKSFEELGYKSVDEFIEDIRGR